MFRSTVIRAVPPVRTMRHWQSHAPRVPFHRLMSSTSTPERHRFLVYAPDMMDKDAFARRLKVRAAHLERASEQHKAGVVSEY